MKTYRISTVVGEDGTVTIVNLPFHEGEELEVILRPRNGREDRARVYPLRGEPVEYHKPFDGVAEGDWDAPK